jgi:uncharacterized protein (DUF427 family)
MARATWKGRIIAQGDDVKVVEGNIYFPVTAVHHEFLRPSSTRTVCSWKGDCSYFDVVVNGEVNRDAAWSYVDPKPAAASIRGWIAFWRGVEVEQ